MSVFLILILTCWAAPVLAQTATTVGTLTPSATFDTIWVKATFSGDSNVNNSVALQYKVRNSSNWLNAYNPPTDRRSTVHGGTSNTANRNQFRAGIFGLTAGQTYDVRVTYSDPDGVIGVATLSSSVTLLSDATVVRSGGTYYLDDGASNGNGSEGNPFNSFAAAFAATNCGDRLIVQPGTYAPFTFSKPCSASTWYVIEGTSRDSVLIGNALRRQVLVDGNYVKIMNLRSTNSPCSFIEVAANRHDVWIENVKADDVAKDVKSLGHSGVYDCDGVMFRDGTYHGYVLNSQFYAPTLATVSPGGTRWDAAGSGIAILGVPNPIGGFVFKGNTIGTSKSNGAFRDCIGNSPESPPGGINYSDILNNKIAGCYDDGIQMEGTDIGLLIAGNVVNADNGYSCFAAQTAYFGPIYWIRNTCRVTWSGEGGYAWKVGGLEFGFFFHNSVETMNAAHDGIADAAGATDTQYIIARNNIIKTQANPLYRTYPTGTSFNYNLYFRSSGTIIASSYAGSGNLDLAGFRAIGQELNGKFGNPLFLDTALHIGSTSPARDAGVSIPNINDANSLWPALGSAPDMGAFETSGGADDQPPGVPQNLQVL
jgi:hypothetical protein